MSYGENIPVAPATGLKGWWERNKQYVYYVIWTVVGFFGGNTDRLDEWAADFGVGGGNTECVCPDVNYNSDADADNSSEDDKSAPDRDYSK